MIKFVSGGYLHPNYRPQDWLVCPDLNGTGVDDFVLLGLKADGTVRLQIRDLERLVGDRRTNLLRQYIQTATGVGCP